MKAIFYNQVGPAEKVLKFGNCNLPNLEKNKILLKMDYSSVNPADTKKRSGWLGTSLDKDFIIPHSDGSGKIIEVGSLINKNIIGKKVWVCGGSKDKQFGTCAEFFQTDLESVVDLPDEISSSVASCLGVPVATAFYSVFSDYE